MKKKLLMLFCMCIMAVSIFFTGCSCTEKGLKDNPPTDAKVISNGGMTVVKGDYLYYVNGYIDETTLTKDDNKYGDISRAGIYRTKLVNGQIVKDKDGFLENTDLVVSKIVGFSNGGFYIIDDYIYYATPYMNLDRDGNLQSNRVEFHRINIDGTNDETLFVTSQNEDNLDWSLYKIDNNVYLTTYVASKIIIYNTTTQKTVVEVSDSTSYAFLDETDYHTGAVKDKEMHNYIYYTRAITSSDGLSVDYVGNAVCKVNIATGKITTLETSKNNTYTIKYVDESSVYYSKKDTKINGNDLLFKKTIISSWNNSVEVQLSNAVYTNYYFCDFGDNLIIASDSNGTYVIENRVSTKVLNTQQTILNVYGGYAYYSTENKLYRFNIRGQFVDGEIETELITDENKTHTIKNEKYIDFDNQRVYVFVDYTSEAGVSNTYLNYITEDLEERFVGKFESKDIPEKPEQNDGYGEDPDVEYVPHID